MSAATIVDSGPLISQKKIGLYSLGHLQHYYTKIILRMYYTLPSYVLSSEPSEVAGNNEWMI